MQQGIVADHALIGTVAEIESRQLLLIVVAAFARMGHAECVRFGHHLPEARIVAGVRIEGPVISGPLRVTAAGGLFGGIPFLVFQHADDVDHRLRVVAGFRQIHCTEPIRFQFVFAAIAGGPGLRQRLQQGGPRLIAHVRHQNRAQRRARAGRGGCALLAYAVACGDMADFVADHARQLGFGIQVRQQPARNVDITAGQRKSIDLGTVDHGEMPGQARAFALFCQPLAHFVDVRLQRGIIQGRVFLQHRQVGLGAHLDFLLFGHQHDVPVPADRMVRTTGQRQHA